MEREVHTYAHIIKYNLYAISVHPSLSEYSSVTHVRSISPQVAGAQATLEDQPKLKYILNEEHNNQRMYVPNTCTAYIYIYIYI